MTRRSVRSPRRRARAAATIGVLVVAIAQLVGVAGGAAAPADAVGASSPVHGDGAVRSGVRDGGARLDPPVVRAPNAWTPTVRTSWDWQIASVPSAPYRDVRMLDVDGFEATAKDVAAMHAAGQKVVCYVSGGTWERWRPDADQFPARLKGALLDEWPGERWLDVRDVQKQDSVLARIMNKRLAMCRAKGFDAVEWDNMDAYQNRPGFPLTARDQLVFNQFMFNNAHAHGMSVLLKNDLDQVRRLLPYVDGVLDEQCFQYDECGLLRPVVAAGKPVFVAEYLETPGLCRDARALGFNAVRFSIDLDGSVFRPCR
jgi:hypothetical protein